LEYILLVLWLIAGFAEAIQDVLTFHFSTSIFRNVRTDAFFGAPMATKGSWTRKYKNGDYRAGPAFWGSTTIFVAFTDAWHLCQLFSRRLPLAVTLAFWVFGPPIDIWAAALVIPLNIATFHFAYNWMKRA